MKRVIQASDWAAALGLAGLALLPAWDAVLSLSAENRGWEPLAWLVGGTLLLTALMLSGVVVDGRARPLLRALAAAVVGLLLAETAAFLYVSLRDALAVGAGAHYRLARNVAASGLAIAAVAVSVLGWRHGAAAVRRVIFGAVALLGALPLVLALSYIVVRAEQQTLVGKAMGRTVVVLVFDELDDTAIAADLTRLPNFAALGRTALAARRMYPPANYTSESLPGMLTGEVFDDASFSLREVHVRPAGQPQWEPLSRRPSLLRDATEAGRHVTLIGWHLPYCAMLRTASSCWDDSAFRAPGRRVSLPVWLLGHSRIFAALEERALAAKADDLSEYSRAFLASPSKYRLHRIGTIFGEQRNRLLAALHARQSQLVFAHLACPHAPSLDPEQVSRLDMFAAYASNLPACDRLLGDVATALQSAARLQGWALIVTSDHWFRGRDWREAGRPPVTPMHRRTVPFYLLLSDGSGVNHSTDHLSQSRVLRRLVGEAADPSFGYARARALIDAQGDAPTILRPF